MAAVLVNDSPQTILILRQLKQYKLCRLCLERHVDIVDTYTIITKKPRNNNTVPSALISSSTTTASSTCYICRGLMDNIDSILTRIMTVAKDYEFNTFLIGATLATQLYEREDTIRARLKIRGRESIKNQLTRELGIRLAKLMKRKVDYMKPDFTINLFVDKENDVDILVKSRPVMLIGRYTKKTRGLPQKQQKCENCVGKGCITCSYSGLSGYDSIEGIIARYLIMKTKCETPKFSWLGGEDQNSLVIGNGRPFSVRIFNPKKRDLKDIKIKGNGVTATLSVSEKVPEPKTHFIVKIRIFIKCENTLTRQELKKLSSLAGSEVSFENKSKLITKKIYTVYARQLSSDEITLTMRVDGGLMIKQFVSGEEYMKSNISEILGTKCKCITFDVLDIAFA